MSSGSSRRVAIAIIGWLLSLPAGTAQAECPNEDAEPRQIGVSDYAASVLCAVNEVRTEFGRPALASQGNLIRAADGFAHEMVDERFFGHTSPDGETYADRLGAAGFIPQSSRWRWRWRAGENLAAGQGAQATPAAIVRAWMESASHRAILLDGGYTLAGVGVARGWPVGDDRRNSMTVVLDLGYLRLARRAARRP